MASILLSGTGPEARRPSVVLLDRLGHAAIVLGGGAEARRPRTISRYNRPAAG